MGNSRTYRGQNVQDVILAQLLAGHEGQPVVVGVDVGKEKLYLMIRWSDGITDRPVVVKQPEQLGLALKLLQGLAQGRELKVALEPSGTYGDPFRYACHRAGLRVERVSPLASKLHAEVYDGVPSQHDGKDAGVIAELCWMGKSTLWPWAQSPEQDQWFVAHLDLMDNYQEEVNVWRGRLEGKLARHWPEVLGLLELDGTTLLEVLIHYQSPAKLAEDGQAAERLAAWGGRFLTEAKILAVLQSAGTTRGAPVGAGEGYHLGQIAQRLRESRQRLTEHHRALEKRSVGLKAVQVAGSVLGRATMAVLQVEAGDPAGYLWGGAYLKALGLNLVERSSGQQVGRLHISKRGSGRARRWLYLGALRVLDHPGIARWFAAKVARDGGRKGKAVVAVMRKLALGVHHCCRDGEVFDLEKVFQDRRGRRGRGNRRRRGRLVLVEGGVAGPVAAGRVLTAVGGDSQKKVQE